MALPKFLTRTPKVIREASEHEKSVADSRPCPPSCGCPQHQEQRNRTATHRLMAQLPRIF